VSVKKKCAEKEKEKGGFCEGRMTRETIRGGRGGEGRDKEEEEEGRRSKKEKVCGTK
jgi:hypothetical protein